MGRNGMKPHCALLTMDTGKIKSVSPGVRPDASGEHASARRSDAGAPVARMISAFLLDASSDGGEGGALTENPSESAPRDGIVVNLSRGVLAAEKDLQLARSAMRAADYSHLDPKTAAASNAVVTPGAAVDATLETAGFLKTAMLLPVASPGAQNADRAGAAYGSTASGASPDLRPDLYAHGYPPVPAQPQPIAAEQKTAASAVSQARDVERLAGLAVRPSSPPVATDTQLGKLILGAIALGVVVLVLL
ncbi:MAG: hypothetical protein JWO70_1902 [Betaproteobacteria bacterium]|nr:hypothetical protein [Betaproteobacteria bacterium]